MLKVRFSSPAYSNKLRLIRNLSNLPSQSQVVIAGAGVVGNSVAYHLIKNGWKDVLLLDQGKICSGTSNLSSGILGLFKPVSQRNIIWCSINLYKELQEMGYDIGLKQCGSINLAHSKDRLIALKRRMAYNKPTGLHCELIEQEHLKRLYPYLFTEDLQGAVWVPEDAIANPNAVTDALVKLAKQGGAVYMENTVVEEVLTTNSNVSGVKTDKGVVKCEYFINCAGLWARELGLNCTPQVRIPAYPAEHFYATTEAMDLGNNGNFPLIRDYDAHTYIKEHDDGFMIGWFQNDAKPAFDQNFVPINWKNYINKNFDAFGSYWIKAVKRMPALNECKNLRLVNCPDTFTPDGRWLLGETPEVKKYFVACGTNGNSLQAAGGIGKAVAEWIIEGEPTQDLLPFHVQRFLDVHNNRRYLKERIKEVVGRNYAILYPHQCEYQYARKLRCSPLYSVLETRGAVFGIKMAYERALYFDSTYCNANKLEMPPGSFYKPQFFDFMKEEFNACREGVGIIDMSSFSKIKIKSDGLEVVSYLQRLCSNDIDVPNGVIVHTGMQNEKGGYENDCMLVRLSENSFFMVSPTSQQTRVMEWMTRNKQQNSNIVLNDVTSKYTVINVVGPKAGELLNELCNTSVNLAPFTYMSVNVGYASDVMVMAFTHTGEPGYCLYVPSEYALHVYYRLISVGRDYGVRDVGVLTQRWMRIERFIPFYAEDLTSFTTPFEAGNSYIVRLDKKENFIGKTALQKQKEEGVTRQLVLFHVNDINPDTDIWPWGGEPLYRNDEFVGTVTSAGYGFAADKLICLGYIRRPSTSDKRTITADFITSKDAKYDIVIADKKFSLTPHLHALTTNVAKVNKYKPTVSYSVLSTY